MMGLFENSWSNTLKFFSLNMTSRLHTKMCQRPCYLMHKFQSQRHEGFDGLHIHRLRINKEEGSTIYSSYQGYQGPQHHQSSGNKDFFKNIIIIFKVSISLKTYPMVPLYIFITIRVPTPQKRGTKTSPLVCNTLWASYA